MIPAGYLCDRYGHRTVLSFTVTLSILLLYVFLSQNGLSFAAASGLLILLGSFLGIVNPIIVSWGNHLVPASPSSVSALLMGFAWCVGNLGPSLAGAIAKAAPTDNYFFALSLMGIFLVIVLSLVFSMPRQAPAAVPEPLPNEPESNS